MAPRLGRALRWRRPCSRRCGFRARTLARATMGAPASAEEVATAAESGEAESAAAPRAAMGEVRRGAQWARRRGAPGRGARRTALQRAIAAGRGDAGGR